MCVYRPSQGIQEPRTLCANTQREPNFLGSIVMCAGLVVAMRSPVTPLSISYRVPMKLLQGCETNQLHRRTGGTLDFMERKREAYG